VRLDVLSFSPTSMIGAISCASSFSLVLFSLASVLVAATLFNTTSSAAETVVRDVNSIVLDGAVFRLDGVDGPELDQTCIDEGGENWPCGKEARNRLAALIADRVVHCDIKAIDPSSDRRTGVCRMEAEYITLGQRLVREGWAINVEPQSKGRFKEEEEAAQSDRAGLWKGCFVAPDDFRRGNKNAKILGACNTADVDEIRDILFADYPAMPAGCSVKGTIALRARITGHRGVYHTPECGNYHEASPNRWFCSEEEATAAGFRKALTC
jgi:endonuclease YncB( thermonuclease family)